MGVLASLVKEASLALPFSMPWRSLWWFFMLPVWLCSWNRGWGVASALGGMSGQAGTGAPGWQVLGIAAPYSTLLHGQACAGHAEGSQG